MKIFLFYVRKYHMLNQKFFFLGSQKSNLQTYFMYKQYTHTNSLVPRINFMAWPLHANAIYFTFPSTIEIHKLGTI